MDVICPLDCCCCTGDVCCIERYPLACIVWNFDRRLLDNNLINLPSISAWRGLFLGSDDHHRVLRGSSDAQKFHEAHETPCLRCEDFTQFPIEPDTALFATLGPDCNITHCFLTISPLVLDTQDTALALLTHRRTEHAITYILHCRANMCQ